MKMTPEELLREIYLERIESNDIEIKEGYEIYWKDIYGGENSIKINHITQNNDIYAWYETNEIGKDKVKIVLKNEIIIEWYPPITIMGISWGGCKFIK